MRKIAILPTLLTLGNAVCGFTAVVQASKITGAADRADADAALFFWCAAYIYAAMLFDVLDGAVARLSRTASAFGGELDSLCDGISFGVAPAFLILKLSPWEEGAIHNGVVLVAVLFMVCALLRLARFNTENSPDPAAHKRFKGLPSPAAAGCVVSLAVLRSHVPTDELGLDAAFVDRVVRLWAPLGGLVVALLMVSRVSYPHLTRQVLGGRRRFSYLQRIILAVFVLAWARWLSVVIVFWGYALLFLGRHAILKARRVDPAALPTPPAEVPPPTNP